MVDYLEALIKLDFTWSDRPDETETLGNLDELHPGNEFPIYRSDVHGIQWLDDFLADAKAVAIAYELHHHTSTCHKRGTACRFHYDGEGKPLFAVTKVDLEKGTIDIKRAHPMVNNHNPAIASVIRSNHDITAIFPSNLKSHKSMYYMTSYVAKGEDDVSDVVAMKEAFEGLERGGVIPNPDIVDQARRLMIRMNWLRQSGRQFSGAQVAAILLRIGNDGIHYTNLSFRRLSLHQFIRYLKSLPLGNNYIQVPNSDHWGDSDSDSDSDTGDSGEDEIPVELLEITGLQQPNVEVEDVLILEPLPLSAVIAANHGTYLTPRRILIT